MYLCGVELKQQKHMKKKNLIFFGDKGLTNTSANHVANLAKEFVRGIEKELQSTSFITTSVELLSGDKQKVLSMGKPLDFIEGITGKLQQLSEAKSLIAWLREAIKARTELVEEVTDLSIAEFCRLQDISYPETPQRPHFLTEDEYYGSLDIKERNRYYYLETVAATIGQYIHPDGPFFAARSKMKEVENEPNKLTGEGVNAMLYTYQCTVPFDVVEDKYFQLQTMYREAQAELNKIKFACQSAIEDSETEANKTYQVELEKVRQQKSEIQAKYNAYISEENARIGKLKIVIPDKLKGIYEIVSNLGKQK